MVAAKPPPLLHLHIQKGPKQGSFLDSSALSSLTIGRARSNSFQIKDHAISQHHLSFDWTGRQWTLTDLGSSNGTTVNGVSIVAQQPVKLKDEDVIKIGTDTTIKAEIQQQARKRKGASPEKVFTQMKASHENESDGITIGEWFAQMVEKIPIYMYEVSEPLIEKMKLQSKQFDEYVMSADGLES